MIKNILQLYALLVCFITVMISIVSFSISLNLVTNLIIPQYKYSSSLRMYASNEAYIQSETRHHQYGNEPDSTPPKASLLQQLSPAQLDEKRLKDRQQYLEDKKADNISSLISIFQWILVAMIFFFIHWKIYKKSERSNLS